MKNTTIQAKILSAFFILLFPFLVSCSVLGGNNYSDNPAVAAQIEEVERLEAELRQAEREAEQAEQRAKAAKNRLEAAEHELKALKSQAKSSGY